MIDIKTGTHDYSFGIHHGMYRLIEEFYYLIGELEVNGESNVFSGSGSINLCKNGG